MNVTVVGATGSGYLTLYPGDQVPPTTSTINFVPSFARSNNALLTLSRQGGLGVRPFVGGAGQVHVVVERWGVIPDTAVPPPIHYADAGGGGGGGGRRTTADAPGAMSNA